jgi:GT2 family glycosyltransferase
VDDRSSAVRSGVDRVSSHRRALVCVLNWNGWQDTLECLETVARSRGVSFQIVVLDNGSTDVSLQRIRDWADGRYRVEAPHRFSHLFRSERPRPIRIAEFARADFDRLDVAIDANLVLVRNEENLGFAGGLNVGIRYALRAGTFDHVWLLNNDTVVEPDALLSLIERTDADPRIGLCGSTLVFYDDPKVVQAYGGFRYNRWLGIPVPIGQGEAWDGAKRGVDPQAERRMNGIQGASVLVPIAFLRDVGELSEDYFLYFEEQDWAERARRADYTLGYAPASIVYHKEGRSTGNNSGNLTSRSELADHYQIQSRILFTRKFHPAALPTVYLGMAGVVVNRVRRRQFRRAVDLIRLAARLLTDPVARPPGRTGSVAGAGGSDRGTAQ